MYTHTQRLAGRQINMISKTHNRLAQHCSQLTDRHACIVYLHASASTAVKVEKQDQKTTETETNMLLYQRESHVSEITLNSILHFMAGI